MKKRFLLVSAILLWCTFMVGLTILRPFNDENIRAVRELTDEEIQDLEHKKELQEWLEEHPEDTVQYMRVEELKPEEMKTEKEEEEVIVVEVIEEQATEDTLGIKKDLLYVSCTVYNPVKSQCWGDPLITADGSKISISSLEKGEIRWIAVSRDLLRVHGFKLGDKVRLRCETEPGINGVWEIHDTMAPRWKKKIDLLQPYGKGLRGTWSNVQIEKIEA